MHDVSFNSNWASSQTSGRERKKDDTWKNKVTTIEYLLSGDLFNYEVILDMFRSFCNVNYGKLWILRDKSFSSYFLMQIALCIR